MNIFLRVCSVFIGVCVGETGWCQESYGISMHGDMKYRESQSFDYVNPQAPKGGVMRLGVSGSFNHLNPFSIKGDAPAGLSLFSERLVFESLMVRAADEPFTLYGLLADKVSIAPDRSWVIFHVNPKAYWSDGVAVTADDILFSYQTLKNEGKPVLQLHYGQVEKAEKLDNRSIKFTFKKNEGKINPEMPMIIGLMSVIPKHAFQNKEFNQVDFKNIPGSGPYKISQVDMGKTIRYKRDLNYWGKNHPKRQGFYNFDEVHFSYFYEPSLILEAFKAGEIDYVAENNPVKWRHHYDFPALQDGRAFKIHYAHERPVGMEGLVFNTRRALFKDPDVRLALSLLYPFKSLNKNLYDSARVRYHSFFENSELAAPNGQVDVLSETGLSAQALERDHLKKAMILLEKAGWHIHKGVLRHTVTGHLFKFEMCLYNVEHQKMALYFKKALKKVGIEMHVRLVDGAQYEKRLMDYDFDMIVNLWGQSLSPGNEQKHYWASVSAKKPGTRNYAGIENPDIDKTCAQIDAAQSRDQLVLAVHTLDRLLQKGIYVIPLGYNKEIYGAYSCFIDHPPVNPKVGIILSTWWYKP